MDWKKLLADNLPVVISTISAILTIITFFCTDNTEENQLKRKVYGLVAIFLVIITCGLLWPGNLSPAQEDTKTESTSETVISDYNDEVEEFTVMQPTERPNEFWGVDVGDIIQFGCYEQDNYTGNGAEPIEWVVLAKKEDRILVISRYALDQQQFHSQRISVTWEDSDIRHWLNHTFYRSAFNDAEKEMIVTAAVIADRNPKYGNDPGNDTLDNVFLLSTQEASLYFKSDDERMCYPTPFVRAKPNVWLEESGCIWWWLRTPGEYSSDATTVNTDGKIDYKDGMVDSVTGTVRPAIWINVE